jgi:hypothetical protein
VIEVLLAKALICFAGQCHPVLTGNLTPVGVYELSERRTDQPGYGGSVLQFKETKTVVYAIHRVFPYDKRMNRAEVLKTAVPSFRRHVTMGCINVEPAVYEQLVSYAKSDRTLVIKEQ